MRQIFHGSAGAAKNAESNFRLLQQYLSEAVMAYLCVQR